MITTLKSNLTFIEDPLKVFQSIFYQSKITYNSYYKYRKLNNFCISMYSLQPERTASNFNIRRAKNINSTIYHAPIIFNFYKIIGTRVRSYIFVFNDICISNNVHKDILILNNNFKCHD